MNLNLEKDDQIAKDRIKTKRIKKKVFMKKMMGIPDRDTNTGEGAEYGSEVYS